MKRKPLLYCSGIWACHLCDCENENDKGKYVDKLEVSNDSMNLRSETLALAAAKRRYSSNTDDKHHFCNFLKQPTTQPVRCCKSRAILSALSFPT